MAVNESKLLYSTISGSLCELRDALGVFHYEENLALNSNQIQLLTNRYGRLMRKHLYVVSQEINENDIEASFAGFLIDRSISEDVKKWIVARMHSVSDFKIYIITHKLYDFLNVFRNLISEGILSDRIVLLCLASKEASLILTKADLNQKNFTEISNVEKLTLSTRQNQSINEAKKSGYIFLPFFILNFLKHALSPVAALKTSHFIWLRRIEELISFIGYQRIKLIPLKYISLMIIYKAYGVLVDLYYLAIRLGHFLERIVIFSYWRARRLCFPFFKIYWFIEFQIQKRLK